MTRVFLSGLLIIHGLIHLLGFAKAYGLAKLPQLTQPISRPIGALWLVAALLMVITALAPFRLFWIPALFALVASQIAIAGSFSDAKFGTIVNVILLLAAVYSFVSQGPLSPAARYRRDARAALASAAPIGTVSEADLAPLPPVVQRYLRFSGAVGQPRVVSFRARWRGRIRGAASEAWMPFDAEQVNTVSSMPARFFFMDAIMRGLPVAVYHRFSDEAASFRAKLLSIAEVVHGEGPEMNRAETVTIFNDLCVLAPSALLERTITWQPLGPSSVKATFQRGAQTIGAELHFDDRGALVDFISDDRLRSSADGKTFTRQRWSTPLRDYAPFGSRRVSASGAALWHAPEGTFAYVEMRLLAITYNITE